MSEEEHLPLHLNASLARRFNEIKLPRCNISGNMIKSEGFQNGTSVLVFIKPQNTIALLPIDASLNELLELL